MNQLDLRLEWLVTLVTQVSVPGVILVLEVMATRYHVKHVTVFATTTAFTGAISVMFTN